MGRPVLFQLCWNFGFGILDILENGIFYDSVWRWEDTKAVRTWRREGSEGSEGMRAQTPPARRSTFIHTLSIYYPLYCPHRHVPHTPHHLLFLSPPSSSPCPLSPTPPQGQAAPARHRHAKHVMAAWRGRAEGKRDGSSAAAMARRGPGQEEEEAEEEGGGAGGSARACRGCGAAGAPAPGPPSRPRSPPAPAGAAS